MKNSTSVEHNFRVMDIVYLMHEDRIWKGIVTQVHIELKSPTLEAFNSEHILEAASRGVELASKVNYPIDVKWVWYNIDIVRDGKFYAGLPRTEQHLVFGKEEELIKSLKL